MRRGEKIAKRKTFAQHILIRTSIIVLCFSILFFAIALPVLIQQISKLVSTQTDALASATIAATENSIYQGNYGSVVEFIMEVLNKSPEALYIKIAQFGTDRQVAVTKDGWKFIDHDLKEQSKFVEGLNKNRRHPFTDQSTLEYEKIINISGLDWGAIIIGISPDLYFDVLESFIRNMVAIYILFVLSILTVIFATSRKIQKQISSLQRATSAVASGNFTSRVEPGEIEEFNQLGLSYNKMSDSLRENMDEANKLAKVVENTSDAVLILNNFQQIIFANKSLQHLMDDEEQDLRGQYLSQIAKKIGIDDFYINRLEEALSMDERLPVSFDAQLLKEGENASFVAIRADQYLDQVTDTKYYFVLLTDITKRKTLEQRLNDMAFYDKLTRLPNRQLFLQRLEEKLAEENEQFALLFLDLDDFKMVNDTMGHEAGDKLLQLVTNRLKKIVGKEDIVCRLGGDEFTVILNGVTSKTQVSNICNRIIDSIQLPISLFNRVVHIGSSIGAVLYPEDGDDLLKKADIAMYEAKRIGKNQHHFFTSELNCKVTEYVQIESELRMITQRNQLVLYYQPIFRADTELPIGFEALIRWKHPTKGTILPGDFIHIAEQSRLILEIGEWVIEEACKTLQKWKEMGFHTRLAVNVSGHQLQEEDFVERALEIINRANISYDQLVMEFTESVLIERKRVSFEKLIKLKNYGIRLALDDFGTGFSSLSYLNYFPIDILKIDRSFISRIPDDYKAQSIVGAILSLTSELGISCVGEGVENEVQANWLKRKDCSYLQGFHYERPLTEDQATELLSSIYEKKGASVVNFTGQHRVIEQLDTSIQPEWNDSSR